MNNAQDLATGLRKNAQRYHDGLIDHDEFTRVARSMWETAERLGCEYDVAAILRGAR